MQDYEVLVQNIYASINYVNDAGQTVTLDIVAQLGDILNLPSTNQWVISAVALGKMKPRDMHG